ncbi:copper amine oxidase N-terminal domain-containing protein [Desulfoscipio gibsoniae]
MLKPKTKRTVSLAIALVFLFTVIAPMGAFAADNDYTKYSSTYNYITADDGQKAGTATVKNDSSETVSNDVYAIQIKLSLPDGVEFTDKPVASGNYAWDKFVSGASKYNFVKSYSNSITIKDVAGAAADWNAGTSVTFDFTDTFTLDVDSDFTGNLDATIEVWGLTAKDEIAWSESDTVTIAKVGGDSDVMVSAKSPKIVSKGSAKKGAEIKVYETKPGTLNDGKKEYVVYDILTSGVTFDQNAIKDKSSIQAASFGGVDYNNDLAYNSDNDQLRLEVNNNSKIFPGDIVFTPYFKVDPKVSGDVKIRVSSEQKDGEKYKSNSTISKTTVTVATVGDAKAKIDELEDNDTVAYSGQITELDVSMKIETEDGNDFKDGDMMTFELNKGKFVKADKLNIDNNNCELELYDNEKAFYVSFNDKAGSDFTVDNFYIQLDNDTEPGDITLTISGDYGDLDEATIGVAAAPFTLKADKTPIMTEALNQAAGDITVNEVADGALQEGSVLVFEIPSGIELNGKPKLDVVSGNFDGDITVIDDSMIALEVTDESSDPSEFNITNINYDTGRLALNGDVEVKAYIIDPDVLDNESDGDYDGTSISDMIDEYDDTGVIATVANATCGSDDLVTATFKVGDEGVAVLNGRTLVQVNTLCDVLGLQKSWDEATKTAYFVQNGKVVAFPMGENAVYINGTKIAVDQGGKIIDNYTYASLRGIQMAFGGELEWDDATKTATFNFNK